MSTDDIGAPPTRHAMQLRAEIQLQQVLHTAPDGWAVANARLCTILEGPPRLQGNTVKITGTLPSTYPGVTLEAVLQPEQHPKWGQQYRVLHAAAPIPTSREGLRDYLVATITDVGPVRANAILQTFDLDTIQVLDSDDAAERLRTEAGIGRGWATRIADHWRAQQSEREAILTLASLGLPISTCIRVAHYFGGDTRYILSHDPYRLLEVEGVGFPVADQVALRAGISPEDPRRLEAALAHVALTEARQNGHCWTPVQASVDNAAGLTGVDQGYFWELLEEGLGGRGSRLVRLEEGRLWPRSLYRAETRLAARVLAIMGCTQPVEIALPEEAWEEVYRMQRNASGEPITLSDEQREAVRALVEEHRICALLGGPGTGKSTLLRAALDAMDVWGVRDIRLCAPTGKAARRMTETTGRPASTIHSLLAREAGDIEGAPLEQLKVEVVVVDEVSMLDVELAHRLFAALPDHAKVILIGDPDQLPPVGPGHVLHDLVEAGLPVQRLTHIFRQAEQSLIVQSAHAINTGQAPHLPRAGHPDELGPDSPGADCIFLEARTPEEVVQSVAELVGQTLPTRFGVFPADVRVLAPQYLGGCGINELNLALQAVVNPPHPARQEREWHPPVRVSKTGSERKRRAIRAGDRLMWLVNDYQRGLVNGSEVEVLGFSTDEAGHPSALIAPLDEPGYELFDGRRTLDVRLDMLDGTVAHSYAVSVHKSQGSEYPCVIVVIHPEHTITTRRLLYTAITRASRLCMVVGTMPAMRLAVARNLEGKRRTGLVERLAPLS